MIEWSNDNIEWVNDSTAVINGGSKYMFRGIIRGQGYPPVTYIADSKEELEELMDGLVLDQWIFYVKEVQ